MDGEVLRGEYNCQKSIREVEKMIKSGNAFMNDSRWLFINSLAEKLGKNADYFSLIPFTIIIIE